MPSETQERQWLEERLNEKISSLEGRVSKLEEILKFKSASVEEGRKEKEKDE